MLSNVVDKRSCKYDVKCDVVYEPSWHDNTCEGATQFTKKNDNFSYEESYGISVAEAVQIAMKLDAEVTIYLYDVGNLDHTIIE